MKFIKNSNELLLDGSEQLVLFFNNKMEKVETGTTKFDDYIKTLREKIKFKKEDPRPFVFTVNENPVSFYLIDSGDENNLTKDFFLKCGSKLARRSNFNNNLPITLFLPPCLNIKEECFYNIAEGFMEGYLLGAYNYKEYSKYEENLPDSLTLVSSNSYSKERFDKLLEKSRCIVESINLARNLINNPPNRTSPLLLKNAIVEHCSNTALKVEVFGKEEITSKKMGGIEAVSRGSLLDPYVVKIIYEPENYNGSFHLGLVGKGITFDTGGINLKPSQGLSDMKFDMSGAAAVMGIMRTLAFLKPKVKVTGIVGLAENMISAAAIKPGDVIEMMNGKTVEVVNTDAEGRLVLADLLYSLKEEKVDRFIDIATLTGSCVNALGDRMTGIMGNNSDFIKEFLAVAKNTFEDYCEFPLYKAYKDQLKSDVADYKNVSLKPKAGAILAGLFLEDFVPDSKPWMHFDIAGTAWSDDSPAHLPKGGTGVPIKSLVEYILSKNS